jgi:hypothetical protein
MMFLRIAMVDAETLQHIVDLLQEPRSYGSEQEVPTTAAREVDQPARARTVRITEPETVLPAPRSTTRQDVSYLKWRRDTCWSEVYFTFRFVAKLFLL